MGRKYTISTGFQSVSVAQDLLEITVPADAAMILKRIELSQSSEAGADEDEKVQMFIKRGAGHTAGSGGSAVTPAKLETGDAAAGITAARNNTTQAAAGSGALDTLHPFALNVLAGHDETPIPELNIVFSPGQACVISIAAPADAITLNCTVWVEEIGG